MRGDLPALEPLIKGHAELRDHIARRVHGEHEMEATLYALVAMKIFGYVFNTYKAIGLLLPDRYYEQGMSLFRTMWESSANLFWIQRDPEVRAKRFTEFTAAEFGRFLKTRRAFFESRRMTPAADSAFPPVIENLLERQVAQFQHRDQRSLAYTRSLFRSVSRGRCSRARQPMGGGVPAVVQASVWLYSRRSWRNSFSPFRSKRRHDDLSTRGCRANHSPNSGLNEIDGAYIPGIRTIHWWG